MKTFTVIFYCQIIPVFLVIKDTKTIFLSMVWLHKRRQYRESVQNRFLIWSKKGEIMEFKEIINTIRQYPWQVTVAVISLIPLYIIDLKFFSQKKSWAEQKNWNCKRTRTCHKRNDYKKRCKKNHGQPVKFRPQLLGGKVYLHGSRKGVLQKILLFSAKQYQIPSADNHKCLLDRWSCQTFLGLQRGSTGRPV